MDNSIAIIICSVNPDRARNAVNSFVATAGVELELHIVDNRTDNRPIAAVYNQAARDCQSPYLLFIHEDVIIETQDWGKILVEKLGEPDCGIIGFAGSCVWLPAPAAWWDLPKMYQRSYYSQQEDGKIVDYHLPAGVSKGFMPVVSLDGVAMAVRRDVWAAHPFDESVLTGFHCYDIDFSVAISRHFTNYVCYGIRLIHLSKGNYDLRWLEISDRIFRSKWEELPPVITVEAEKNVDIKAIEQELLYKSIMRRLSLNSSAESIKADIEVYEKRYAFRSVASFLRYRRMKSKLRKLLASQRN